MGVVCVGGAVGVGVCGGGNGGGGTYVRRSDGERNVE